MKLTITGRHMTVTETMRRDLTRKLGRLERLLNDRAVSAQCILERDGRSAICDLTVHARGDHMLHGEGRHERMGTAMTRAVAKVAQQAQKLKDRWTTRRRKSSRLVEEAPEPVTRPARRSTPKAPRVVRSKARLGRAMTVPTAIAALERSEHPFLVFREHPTDAVVVLYRRPDGQFGLVDTGA